MGHAFPPQNIKTKNKGVREYSQYAKYSNQVCTSQLNITNISSLGHAFPRQNIKNENRGLVNTHNILR